MKTTDYTRFSVLPDSFFGVAWRRIAWPLRRIFHNGAGLAEARTSAQRLWFGYSALLFKDLWWLGKNRFIKPTAAGTGVLSVSALACATLLPPCRKP